MSVAIFIYCAEEGSGYGQGTVTKNYKSLREDSLPLPYVRRPESRVILDLLVKLSRDNTMTDVFEGVPSM